MKVTLSNTLGKSTSQTFIVVANVPPTLTAISGFTVYKNAAKTLTLVGTDTTNGALTYTLTYQGGAMPTFIDITNIPTIIISPVEATTEGPYSFTAKVTDA